MNDFEDPGVGSGCTSVLRINLHTTICARTEVTTHLSDTKPARGQQESARDGCREGQRQHSSYFGTNMGTLGVARLSHAFKGLEHVSVSAHNTPRACRVRAEAKGSVAGASFVESAPE